MTNKADVKEFIKGMTVLELAELIKELETELGVSAAATVVATAAAPAAAAEEKTEFNVVLKSSGATKLNVIKEVRALTGLGLKEAKDLVDNCPSVVKEGIPKAEAEAMRDKLVAAGAEIEIK
ncbi:MAG TPA: 50S ribosomal protein L7/L12 [bacterium]|nr:50S ribosomal protein L7/L12 [bacterium]HPS29693.1 50S ribosomal protein L7/L12 [bacterium]